MRPELIFSLFLLYGCSDTAIHRLDDDSEIIYSNDDFVRIEPSSDNDDTAPVTEEYDFCNPLEAIFPSEDSNQLPYCISAQNFLTNREDPVGVSVLLYTGNCELNGHQHKPYFNDQKFTVGDESIDAVVQGLFFDPTVCEEEGDPDDYLWISFRPEQNDQGIEIDDVFLDFSVYLLNNEEFDNGEWVNYHPLLGSMYCSDEDHCNGYMWRE